MINLLPDEDKISIKREYRRRLMVVAGIFLFSLIFFAIILFSPSYFFLISRKNIFKDHLAVIEKGFRAENGDKVKSSISDLNNRVKFLSDQHNKERQLSVLIRQILAAKSSAVVLSSFSYRQENDGRKEYISLRGSAENRPNFMNFIKSLEELEDVASVFSPASNLLRDKDISFVLTLELAPVNQINKKSNEK